MHLLIVAFLTVMWGLSPIVYKHFLGSMDFRTVMFVVGMVNFLGASALYIVNSDSIDSDISKLPLKSFVLLCLLVLCSYFLAHTLYMYALQDNPSYVMASITSVAPVVTFLVATLFLGQKVEWLGIAGVLLTSAGVTAIVVNSNGPK